MFFVVLIITMLPLRRLTLSLSKRMRRRRLLTLYPRPMLLPRPARSHRPTYSTPQATGRHSNVCPASAVRPAVLLDTESLGSATSVAVDGSGDVQKFERSLQRIWTRSTILPEMAMTGASAFTGAATFNGTIPLWLRLGLPPPGALYSNCFLYPASSSAY